MTTPGFDTNDAATYQPRTTSRWRHRRLSASEAFGAVGLAATAGAPALRRTMTLSQLRDDVPGRSFTLIAVDTTPSDDAQTATATRSTWS